MTSQSDYTDIKFEIKGKIGIIKVRGTHIPYPAYGFIYTSTRTLESPCTRLTKAPSSTAPNR